MFQLLSIALVSMFLTSGAFAKSKLDVFIKNWTCGFKGPSDRGGTHCDTYFVFADRYVAAAESISNQSNNSPKSFTLRVFTLPTLNEHMVIDLPVVIPNWHINEEIGIITAGFFAEGNSLVACTNSNITALNLRTKKPLYTWNSTTGKILNCALDETNSKLHFSVLIERYLAAYTLDLTTLTLSKPKMEPYSDYGMTVIQDYHNSRLEKVALPSFLGDSGLEISSKPVTIENPEYPGMIYRGFALWISDIVSGKALFFLKNSADERHRGQVELAHSEDRQYTYISEIGGRANEVKPLISSVYNLQTGQVLFDLLRDMNKEVPIKGVFGSGGGGYVRGARFSADNRWLFLTASTGQRERYLEAIQLPPTEE